MDEPNQKPTDKMLKEARRLAFFADEVLSQSIIDDYDKTEKYITRHTQSLVEQQIIEPAFEYYAYTPEEIKTYNKWFNSVVRKAVYFPVLAYALISWYFLSTPMENWIFNLGQYNPLLLQWFPESQFWVNISTDHREKMILLYVIYTFFSWLIILLTIYQIMSNIKKFTSEFVPTKAKLCGQIIMVLPALCLILFLVIASVSGLFIEGSKTFLMPSDLDNSARQWVMRDDSVWNNTAGFLFMKSLSLMTLGFLLFGMRAAPMIWLCKKMPK